MKASHPRSPARVRTRDPVRDGLVVLCMTIVTLALGIGLHLQFALAFWLAVVAALAVYVVLLSTHVLVQRRDNVEDLRREVARLEARLGRPMQTTASSSWPAGYTPISAPGSVFEAAPGSGSGLGSFSGPSLGSSLAPSMAGPLSSVAPASPAASDYWNFLPEVASTATPARGPAARTQEPDLARTQAPDLRHLRPATGNPGDRLPEDQALSSEAPIKEIMAPMSSAQQRNADADQINAVIRKLAADITQGQAAMALKSIVERDVATEVDASVAALHAAADAMRESTQAFEVEPARSVIKQLPPALPKVAVVGAAPPALDPATERLAAIADALERERFDVMLEPILGLKDRRAQHYIVTVQLKDSFGDITNVTDAGPAARGSGLLPLLDAVKVECAARVAWRMEDRGKPGALFSQLSGESLVSDRFLNRFADTYRQGDTLGGRLVLSFRQAELRAFSDLQWSTLRDMNDLGFRFCIEDITDLDLDFGSLSAAGFTFAKLDAAVFFDGLPMDGGVVPAGDICRHLANLKLAVIVAEISDAALSTRLQAYGVELGQGRLFGAPRAVKADVLRIPHAAVA